MSSSKGLLYTDGASKGNPGRAGIGVVIVDQDGTTVAEIAEYIGHASNNEAEYRALIRGLREAALLKFESLVWITDSELLARQWSGRYAVKAANLASLYAEAKRLAQAFSRVAVQHTLRGGNARADGLANQAIKEHFAGS